jgi:GTPase SAR1 family protein
MINMNADVELKTIFDKMFALNDILHLSTPYLIEPQYDYLSKQLKKLHKNRESIGTEPIKIVLAGNFSSGKSVFLNSLLGDEIVPFGEEPMTMIPNMFRYGSRPDIEIEYNDGRKKRIDLGTFSQLIHTTKIHSKIEDIDNIKIINFYHDSPFLLRYTIIDTPGFSTAVEKGDDLITESIIIEHADVLLWVTDINSGELSRSELDILEKVRNQKKGLTVACILNKCDTLGKPSSGKVQTVVNKVKNQLEKDYVYPFSSKEVLNYEKNIKRGLNKTILEVMHNCKEEVTIGIQPDRKYRIITITASNKTVIREDIISDFSDWLEPLDRIWEELDDLTILVNRKKSLTLSDEILEWEEYLQCCLKNKVIHINYQIKNTYTLPNTFYREIDLIKVGMIKNFENSFLEFSNIVKHELTEIIRNHVSLKKNGIFDDNRKIVYKKSIDRKNVENFFKSTITKYLLSFESEIKQMRELLCIHKNNISESSFVSIELFLLQSSNEQQLRFNLVNESITSQLLHSLIYKLTSSTTRNYLSSLSDQQVFSDLAVNILDSANIKSVMDIFWEISFGNLEKTKDIIQESARKEKNELKEQINDIEEIIKLKRSWRKPHDKFASIPK